MTENTTGATNRSELGRVGDAIRAALWRPIEWLANRNAFAIMATGFALGFVADRTPVLDPYGWVFYLAGGFLPIVLQTVPTSEDGFDADVSNGERIRILLSMLRLSVTPWGILMQVVQIVGNVVPYVRYRGKLPNRERHVPETEPTAPFDGEWTTVNGGVTKATSHSWGIVSQRYAYDFVITDEDGSTHEGDGDSLEDYYAYGEPIRAPADGTVVSTMDSLRDYPKPGSGWTEWRTWRLAGNHVTIEHADGEYSFLAHLREGSVTVEPGEEVERGDVVGECGNSGNSTEPHLHYQLMDRRNFWTAAGLVPRFWDVAVSRPDDRRADHHAYDDPDAAGDDGLALWAGDRVSRTA